MVFKFAGTIARMYNNNPPDYFVDSLAELLLFQQKQGWGAWNYDKSPVSWHEGGRNQIAQNFLDFHFGDWLLMLDTDHAFAPDVLERLLRLAKKHDRKVISALYLFKNPPHWPVGGFWQKVDDREILTPITKDHLRKFKAEKAEVVDVGAVGGGCLLMHREVLHRVVSHFGVQPFTLINGLSEDYSFCFRCKELQIPIGLAVNVECHHAKTGFLHSADFVG